jgi:hypothetical protein
MTHNSIDLDLVDKTIALIPEHAWTQVRQAIVTALVDNMPGVALEKLTGTYDDFDLAEEILYTYYVLPDLKHDLIVDAFKIMGAINCLELLNSLSFSTEDGIPTTATSSMSCLQNTQSCYSRVS